MKARHYIFVLIAFTLGFFLGRETIGTKEKVRYVQGETVRDTVRIPTPVRETIPGDPVLIYKRDTIYTDTGRVIYEKVDTSAIIQDYITRRLYAFEVYNDDYGSMNVDSLTVQYNQLTGFHYTRIPKQKVISTYKEPLFTPFVSGSYSTFNVVGAGGGVFIKNFGIEYQYQYNYLTKERGHGVGVKVRF